MTYKVAVYGSLKQGFHNHPVMRQAGGVYEDTVSLEGYDMFNLGSFPGIKEGTGTIEAELYQVSDLRPLDWLEGYHPDYEPDSLYLRRTVKLDGEDVYVYVYNGEVSRKDIVEDGKW